MIQTIVIMQNSAAGAPRRPAERGEGGAEVGASRCQGRRGRRANCSRVKRTTFMHGLSYRFNDLRFKHSQTTNDLPAASKARRAGAAAARVAAQIARILTAWSRSPKRTMT